jgi:hypothetical protein
MTAFCVLHCWCGVPLHKTGSSERMAGDLTCTCATMRDDKTDSSQVDSWLDARHGKCNLQAPATRRCIVSPPRC